ncbi:MAG: Uncharacterised protein [Flavobacteriia bacterium]|nr:MAG: Uncharacterised protein [Flavobacteriia bacterium]
METEGQTSRESGEPWILTVHGEKREEQEYIGEGLGLDTAVHPFFGQERLISKVEEKCPQKSRWSQLSRAQPAADHPAKGN